MKYRLSNEPFDCKPDVGSPLYGTIQWSEYVTDTPNEIYEALLKGYACSHVFNGWNHRKANFLCSYCVFVDIDHSKISLHDFILERWPDMGITPSFMMDSLPPTFAYYSFRNGFDNEFRFRLCWCFSRPLNAEQYCDVLNKILNESHIDDYDHCTHDVSRYYLGTNNEGMYFGDVYDPQQFISDYVEDVHVVDLIDNDGDYLVPREVNDDMFGKDKNQFEALMKYTGRRLDDFLTSKPTFQSEGAKLWVKSDYKKIIVPFKNKIKDGSKRRYKFSMMMREVIDITPDIKFYQLFIVGVLLCNLYFEKDKDFGDAKSVRNICRAVFGDKQNIVWYSQSLTKGNYVVSGLKDSQITRKELIERYEASFTRVSEAIPSGECKNCTEPLYYNNNILVENRKFLHSYSKKTEYNHRTGKTKEKPKPTTMEELEMLYATKQMSRRSYYNWKKKLKD